MECNHLIQGEDWTLLPEKAVYWATEKTLIVSDLHLGKISHFRKSGLAVPFNAKDKNLEELSFLLLNYDIEQVIFLGDLFHSKNNAATALYSELFDRFPDLHLILVKGNHDIFDNNVYDELSLDVVNSLTLGPFYFTHEPEEHKNLYNIAGHVHPAVRLLGKARSSMRLPCFYFSEFQAILPSFGVFTGSFTIKPKENDQIYAILPDGRVTKVSA